MTIKHFEKILFNSALIILPITFAHGVTITYDLKGGVLPDGTGSYQTETNNNEVVLDNPIRTNYTFAGWCEKTDYESDGVCDSPIGVVQENGTTYYRWVVPANLNADTDYVAMWNAVEVTCPTNVSENIALGNSFMDVSELESGWTFAYDFDGQNGKTQDECVKLVMQAEDPEGLPTAISLCRYTNGAYFGNCATPVATCSEEDLMALTEAGSTDNLVQVFATMSGLQSPSDLTFNQSGANLGAGMSCSGGSAFTCESNTWLHVGNEQICTYATKTTDRALAIRVDANHVYYVMLTPASENDYPIHAGSNHKLKIREYNAAGTESTIYNAHDMSVVSE